MRRSFVFILLLAVTIAASAKSIHTNAELRLYDEVRKDVSFEKYYWFSGCGETMEQADEMALFSIPNAAPPNYAPDGQPSWNELVSSVHRICLSDVEYNGKVCNFVTLLYCAKEEVKIGEKSLIEDVNKYVEMAQMVSDVDALRYYTWAYALLAYCSEEQPIKIEDMNARQFVSRRIRAILSEITVKVSSIEKCRKSGEYPYKVYLDFLYEDEPLDYITFSYFDGVSMVAGQGVKDGRSVVMMRKLPAKFDVTIDCYNLDIARLTDVGVYLRLLYSKSSRSAIDGSVKRVEPRPAKSAPRKRAYTGEYAEILNDIVASINGASNDIRHHFTDKAWVEYRKLVAELKPTLARTPAWNIVKHGGVAVCRELPLRLTDATFGKSHIEDVVFRINEHTKKIESVVYKLPAAVEKSIMGKMEAESEGVALITMLEQYRTAYYLRDLNYIRSLLKKGDSKASYTELLRSQALAARSLSEGKVIYVNNTKNEYFKKVAKGCLSGRCSLRINNCEAGTGYGSKSGLYTVRLYQTFTSAGAGADCVLSIVVDVKSGAEPTVVDARIEYLF